MFNFDEIDLHIHTAFSDGRCSLEEVLHIAHLKGLRLLAITDHYDEFQNKRRRISKGQLKGYLDALETAGVLKGVEADIFGDGGVSISRSSADLCDVVIGGLHTLNNRFIWSDPRPIWDPKSFVEDLRLAIIKAMETGLLDILAHPTCLPWFIRYRTNELITSNWIESVACTAVNNGVAIEISGAHKVPHEKFIRECLHLGVKLSVGSDAHNPSMIGDVSYPVEMLRRVRAQKDAVFIPKAEK